MKPSKLLAAFQVPDLNNYFELIGDILLVEEIPDEEFKTKTGLIIASGNKGQVNGLEADKPTFVRVLMVGQGYFDSSDKIEKDIPCDSMPGDIVLIGRTSLKPFSVFGKLMTYGEAKIGICRESDIQARFRGEEAFERFFESINKALETQVEQHNRGA